MLTCNGTTIGKLAPFPASIALSHRALITGLHMMARLKITSHDLTTDGRLEQLMERLMGLVHTANLTHVSAWVYLFGAKPGRASVQRMMALMHADAPNTREPGAMDDESAVLRGLEFLDQCVWYIWHEAVGAPAPRPPPPRPDGSLVDQLTGKFGIADAYRELTLSEYSPAQAVQLIDTQLLKWRDAVRTWRRGDAPSMPSPGSFIGDLLASSSEVRSHLAMFDVARAVMGAHIASPAPPTPWASRLPSSPVALSPAHMAPVTAAERAAAAKSASTTADAAAKAEAAKAKKLKGEEWRKEKKQRDDALKAASSESAKEREKRTRQGGRVTIADSPSVTPPGGPPAALPPPPPPPKATPPGILSNARQPAVDHFAAEAQQHRDKTRSDSRMASAMAAAERFRGDKTWVIDHFVDACKCAEGLFIDSNLATCPRRAMRESKSECGANWRCARCTAGPPGPAEAAIIAEVRARCTPEIQKGICS